MPQIIIYLNVIAQQFVIKDCKIWLTKLVWMVLRFARMKRILLWTKISIYNQQKVRTLGTTNYAKSSQSIYLTNKNQRANRMTTLFLITSQIFSPSLRMLTALLKEEMKLLTNKHLRYKTLTNMRQIKRREDLTTCQIISQRILPTKKFGFPKVAGKR